MYISQTRWFCNLEVIILFLILFFYSGAFPIFINDTPFMSVIKILLQLSSFLIIIVNFKKILSIIKHDKLLLLFIVYTILSIFWAQDTSSSIHGTIAIIWTTLVGYQIVSKFSIEECLHFLAKFFFFIILLNLICVFFFPEYGIASGAHEGAWKGIFGQKNRLGIIMTYSTMVFLAILLLKGNKKKGTYFGLFLSILLIIFSKSSTSFVVVLLIILFIPTLKLLKLDLRLFLSISLFLVSIIITCIPLFSEIPRDIANYFGKDLTLTGRTEIWEVLINDYISQRYWFGYGYNVFWSGETELVEQFFQKIGFISTTAHNGFLDIWLDLGIIGLIIFCINYLKNFLKLSVHLKGQKRNLYYWALFYFIVMLFYNFSESLIFSYNSLSWLFYVMAASYININNGYVDRKS